MKTMIIVLASFTSLLALKHAPALAAYPSALVGVPTLASNPFVRTADISPVTQGQLIPNASASQSRQVLVAPTAVGEMSALADKGVVSVQSVSFASKGVVSEQSVSYASKGVVSEQLQREQLILEMAAAFKKNDSRTLTRLLPRAKGSQLEPWAAYWELKARLNDADQADIDRFAKRYPHTYQGDRLRADWLLSLGQRRDWTGFAANLPAYRMRDDKDIRCYAARDDAALIEATWRSQKEVNTGCGFVANALIDAGKLDAIVAWRKGYKGQTPPQAAWDKLTVAQKNWAWGFEGKSLAQKLDLTALQSFANVTRAQDLSDDMLGWWTRAALRRKDWALVQKAIGAMTDEGQREWEMWLGVAARQGEILPQPATPMPANADISPVLQGQLSHTASARQSRQVLVAPTAVGEMPAVRAKGLPVEVGANPGAIPGLNRALYAIQIGLRPEGVREWNYEVNLARGSMSDEDRIAAAELACKAQVWDRCINTSERTTGVINWQQRYPVPFKAAITTAAQEHNLDAAFVFGLIRQESRFIADAKSHVGAAGLMQLMPPTAKWTAKRIGLHGFTADQVHDIDTNVRLGTGYLKYVLDEFGGNPALAAAAYNAGPHRVKQWRTAMAADTGVGTPLDLAIWSENIPFTETRDYVKKVLANTEVYRLLLK